MSVTMQDETFVQRASMVAVAEREVGATPDAVFAVLADAPSWETWFPNLQRARWTTAPPYGVGSRRVVKVGPLKVEEEFIVWEPGRRWGFTFVEVNLPGAKGGVEIVELTPVGDARCHVRYTMAIEPVGLLKPLAGPFQAGSRKALQDALESLDAYVSGGSDAGR